MRARRVACRLTVRIPQARRPPPSHLVKIMIRMDSVDMANKVDRVDMVIKVDTVDYVDKQYDPAQSLGLDNSPLIFSSSSMLSTR